MLCQFNYYPTVCGAQHSALLFKYTHITIIWCAIRLPVLVQFVEREMGPCVQIAAKHLQIWLRTIVESLVVDECHSNVRGLLLEHLNELVSVGPANTHQMQLFRVLLWALGPDKTTDMNDLSKPELLKKWQNWKFSLRGFGFIIHQTRQLVKSENWEKNWKKG